MSEKTFADYEREGWERNAATYDEIDLPATVQAIIPILDSLGPLNGVRLLEVGSGTGHLAKAAVARGATVMGVDVASNMVKLARQLVSDATFREADGEALPLPDNSFDCVVCSFSLNHMAHPDQAIREAARVLSPGGRFGFTVWYGADKGNDFFAALGRPYQEHADMNVNLPPGASTADLSDPVVHAKMLQQAGFEDVTARDLAILWPLRGPETLLEFALMGAVRTRMLYERQKPDVQRRIREAMVEAIRPYILAGKDGIPCPAVLVTGRMPQ